MEENRDGKQEKKWKIVTAVCVSVAVVAAVVLVWTMKDFYAREQEAELKMEDLRVEIETQEESEEEPVETQKPLSSPEPTEEPKPLEKNPYAELFAQNRDMAAWIVVDGTVMDYPVMQTPEDENYYLDRDFYGKEDKAGCLILDVESALDGENATTNLIIHGHNMKAGTMFGGLDEYTDQEYCDEHKHMEIYTRTEKREYEVISVFYSQVYYPTDLVFKYYNFFHADDELEFAYFYDNIKELALYDTGVTAQLGDHFLTLSTCAYHVEDGRLVVVAKEVSREEKYEDPGQPPAAQ